MTAHRRLIIAGSFVVVTLLAALGAPAMRAAGDTLPSRMSDDEFWQLSEQLSEPNGYFRSDNLLSNEIWFQHVIPLLLNRTDRNGVYMGVGPEQNFTYIAATRPKLVFIPDIRRGNLQLHLMYKALFELSGDRGEFVSRLFTKKRPNGITSETSSREIFEAFENVPVGNDDDYGKNLRDIDELLTKKHHLPLGTDDLAGISYVYHNFYMYGPEINYNSSQGNGARGGNLVSYRDLMTETDESHVSRSYLATEDSFKSLRDLEEKNLIVPVVGDLAGPKALRAIGQYVKDHKATVSVFYLSNVEQYLTGNGVYMNFCSNVATLPLDTRSTFIRSTRTGYIAGRGGMISVLGSMKTETDACTAQ